MDPIKRLLACALVALAAPCAWAHSPAAPGSPHAVPAALPASPLSFEENKGQVRTIDGTAAPEVRYRLTQGNTQLFLLANGIAYQFSRTHYPEGYAELAADTRHDHEKQAQLDAMTEQIRLETFRMDMRLDGASTNARITTEGRSSDYTQYYNHDALDVHSYTKVTYHEVYPGIDWVVYTTEARHPGASSGVKYDFVVRPGADPNLIRLRFEHHEELELDAKGDPTLANRMGHITEQRPVSFQDGAEVATRFVLEGDLLRFELDGYDRSKALTIDPELIWGTYYGGIQMQQGGNCATDGSGNVYFSTWGVENGLASGGYQNVYAGGFDALLVKFDGNGVRQWATYYGGSHNDYEGGLAVDGNGNVFLSGGTLSTSGIAHNGHQMAHGGQGDLFLVKFNSDGLRQWATYYGGSGYELYGRCATDGNGNVYLASIVGNSIGLTSGGFQNVHGGGSDALLVKFSPDGIRQWATFYGGSGSEWWANCAADASGNVYLSGHTNSTSGIASGGHQLNYGGGEYDLFLVKFSPSGSRIWASYYGGSVHENAGGCAVDADGNVFLSGVTNSTSGIASGGHQNSFAGAGNPGGVIISHSGGFGGGDALLVKFNGAGVRQWATYYGGSHSELIGVCSTDPEGNIYLAGNTVSASGIAFEGYMMTYSGTQDGYVVKFSPDGSREWGTYYGGNSHDLIEACAAAPGNVVYLAGWTMSSSGMAVNGHQNSDPGPQQNGCLAKIGTYTPDELTTGSISGSPFCEGAACLVPFTAADIFNAGNIFTAQLSDGTGSFDAPVEIGTLTGTTSGTINATIPLGTPLGTGYRIRVIASDPATEGSENPNDLAVSNMMTWYPDEDGDGYGSPTGSLETCAVQAGYVQNNADDCPTVFGLIGSPCDDEDATTENDVITEECECEGISVLPIITGYRYWFDDDIANAVTTTVDPVDELLIEEAFLADGLDGGLRRVSVQAQDNMGYWSSPQTSLFARVDAVVSGYRYWVNDDPSNMLTGTVTPAGVVDLSAALPISGADRPFNLITIQFLDPAGVYSAPLTKAFALTHGLVSGYRYWVNDDPTTMQTVTVSPVELLDLTSPLAIGIADRTFNILTIQFRDEGGIFSVPYTTTFVRSTGPIVEYEYWIDDVIANRVAGNVGPADVADLIDDLPTSAPPGPHVFTIRFRGESGAWSVPLTTNFISNMVVYDCPDLEANIGDACDPGPGFENGEVTEACVCEGTPIIVYDCPALEANIGDACDAGPGFENGEVTEACVCEGTPIIVYDCPALEANIGDACDAGPGFENGEVTAECECVGDPIIVFDCPALEANIGDACDPGPGFENGEVTEACMCEGTPIIIYDCPALEANIGDACDPGPGFENGEVTEACVCEGTPIIIYDCPALEANIGDACDPGPGFENGEVTEACMCEGTPVVTCTTALEFDFTMDSESQMNWEIREDGTNDLMQSGSTLLGPNELELPTCLPNGCFHLIVTDAQGDGIAGGGYVLRLDGSSQPYNRIIDNRNNYAGVNPSQVSGPPVSSNAFCIPMSAERLIFTSCDKLDWKSGPCGYEYIVANSNPTVTAAYSSTNGTHGYEMWWFNPNGGYSFRRTQFHNTANGMAASSTRACHFKLNSWSGNQLTDGVLYNVKVRAIIAGNPTAWGPACRMKIDQAASECPKTKLHDIPGESVFSCGATRAIASNVLVHARPVRRMLANCSWQNANRYQFRFRVPGQPGLTVTKTSNTNQYFVNTAGLICGTVYEVDVRASFTNGSSWCAPNGAAPWGDVCQLITVACNAQGGNQNMVEDASTGSASELRMYPNPNRGDQLFLSIEQLEEDVRTVSVDIFDGFGKRVSARTIAVQGGFLNTVVELNGELATGMYLVNITAGDKVYTERLVIQP
ncbi:MAG: T9SS type A sorting domain-containing protein [Flavobacteriales bacterium]|nr:T9SS type A sorting domain-containing protein [Flavobacteriales bacterium]